MLKRAVGFAISLMILTALSPLLLVISLAIYWRMGWPIFFQQPRPGKHGKIFHITKFRTMTSDTDSQGNLLPDAQRLPRLGRLLRSTSLDELPAFWNVLKGDMSLVGPRPLLVEYLPLYNARQARRHEVRPGLTGWAQINGRNAISWQEKFELDVWYVDNRSFWLDCKIILLTIKKVFIREGISAQGEATMSKFTGDESRGNKNAE